MGEEESREPEVGRSSIVNPVLHKLKSLEEIKDPRCEWLKRWISSCVPNLRHNIVEQAGANIFKLLREWNLSLDSFSNINQGLSHDGGQLVVSEKLLLEHSV